MLRAATFFALPLAFVASANLARASLVAQGGPLPLDAPHRCGAGDPSLAALKVGFVAVWTDGARLTSRRLDAVGRPAAPEVVLAEGQPKAPEVVGLPGGGWAVVWFDASHGKLLARFAEAEGGLGPEVEVGSASGFSGLDATAGPDGALAIVWTSGAAVYLRELRADGSALGPPFTVDAYDFIPEDPDRFFFASPVVLAAPDRSLVVFWVWVWGSGVFIPNRDGEIVRKRLARDPGGSGYRQVGATAYVGSGHGLEGAIASDGNYLLAWAGTTQFPFEPPYPIIHVVFALAFGPGDVPVEEYPSLLDDYSSTLSAELAVTSMPGGRYVVAWQTETGPPTHSTVTFARELSESGQPRGEPVPLGLAGSSGQVRPDLAVGADGLVLSSWEELEDPLVLRPTCAGEHIRTRPYRTACDLGACLGNDGRFELTLDYFDPRRNVAGRGQGVALTRDTAYFWFFAADNVEVVAKVIDGRAVNGHFWFFWGGLTDLGLRLTLRDTETGKTRTYSAEPGTMVSAADVNAVFGGDPFTVQKLRVFELDRQSFPAAAQSQGTTVPVRTATKHDPAPGGPGPCSPPELPVVPGPGLCLTGERFEVEATWSALGRSGMAEGVELGDDSGYLWFFAPENVELVVKVLDGRAVNGRFWVFYGALTDVDYELVVRHAVDARDWRHHNPRGRLASGSDVDALVPPDCGCTAAIDPVCGRDGRVYGNACEAYCFGWVAVDPFGASCTP